MLVWKMGYCFRRDVGVCGKSCQCRINCICAQSLKWYCRATNPSRTRGVIKPARAADASLADTSLNLISTSIASELEQVSATIEEPADSRLFAGWQRHPHATGPVLFHVAPAPKQQDWEETITVSPVTLQRAPGASSRDNHRDWAAQSLHSRKLISSSFAPTSTRNCGMYWHHSSRSKGRLPRNGAKSALPERR